MIEQLKAIPKLLRLSKTLFRAGYLGKVPDDLPGKVLWQQQRAIEFLDALQVEVRCQGGFPTQGLIVCNHLSYLDILAIASQGPVVFVAKSELSEWPLIGKLLQRAGTILAYRNQPLKSAQTADEIESALSSKLPVVLFPEGTSTNGEKVQTFRSPFFQPAQAVSADITPAAILYTSESGDPKNDICYWGDHVFSLHIMKLLTLRKVVARLSFGDAQPCCPDRKESALYFHKQVSKLHQALKAKSGS